MIYHLKDDSKDKGRSGRPHKRKGDADAHDNFIEFAFWKGKKPATIEELNAAKNRALDELEEFAKGEKPADEAGLRLHQALNRRSAKVKITIVTIDPKDVTASFSGPMRQLDKFLPKSRERFLADAVSHLGSLRPKEGEFAPMYALCHALLKARKGAGGNLGQTAETMLAGIRADEKLPARKALLSAERAQAESEKDRGEESAAKDMAFRYDARDRGRRDSGVSM